MTDKLISMVDFVLELNEIPMHFPGEVSERLNQYVKYAKFLKTPLQLGHFVPVHDGEVLKEPLHYNEWKSQKDLGYEHEYDGLIMKRYEQAKSRCLFEGFATNDEEVFEPHTGMVMFERSFDEWFKAEDDIETIEDLVPYGLTLTPYAKELIYGKS